MSTITPSRPEDSTNKDDYTKHCHYTIRHYTCGHRKWPKPRVAHIGCPESPTSKRRCDNMASRPKDVYTGEACSQCRPAKSKQMCSDAFDTLIQKTWADAKNREHISKMAHLASEALLKSEGGERGLVKLDMRNLPTGKTSQEEKTNNDTASPQILNMRKSGEEQKPENFVNQIVGPSAQTSLEGQDANQPPPKSLLSSVWNLMKPNNMITEAPTQNTELKGWSDVEEEVDWEAARDEDRQLWKDKGDWVHVS